jgi:hypothetical protein
MQTGPGRAFRKHPGPAAERSFGSLRLPWQLSRLLNFP